MDWLLYAVVLPFVLLALALGLCALHWAAKHGQVRELWLTVRSLFTRESGHEPSPDLLPPEPSGRRRASSHS